MRTLEIKLACIQKLMIGKDGQTRGAVLRVASAKGQSTCTVLQHPLQRLYPLEISSSTSGQEEVPDHLTQDDGDDGGHVQQSEVRV